jgi:hypothetical protein
VAQAPHQGRRVGGNLTSAGLSELETVDKANSFVQSNSAVIRRPRAHDGVPPAIRLARTYGTYKKTTRLTNSARETGCMPHLGNARDITTTLPARFWWYSAFTAVSMFGFSTFGVISYDLKIQKVMPRPYYAVSMGQQLR